MPDDDVVAPRPGSTDHRWQSQEAGAVHGNAGARRRFWFFFLGGLFLALASLVVVGLLLMQPPAPAPYFLSIHISDYDARQYPVLAFAKQDGKRILQHFPQQKQKQAETKTKDLLHRELKALAGKTEPLIVHITALALVRDDKVYLLPGDADPDDESTWVDVRDVLTAIADCRSKQKLLILDLSHPLANPRLGVLDDRVAETLEEYLTKNKPVFFVLCPCSAGQYSLTSEALQCSVLAYYLDQGLQGHAAKDKGLRVTVRELFTFVEARVDRWAQKNLGLRQKPRLFGDPPDFTVANIAKVAGASDRPELEAYPGRFQKGWKDRDDWWDKEAFRRAPRILHKLNANLLRQEKRWRGGAVPKEKEMDGSDEIQSLSKELEGALAVRSTPPKSLALALSQAGTKEIPGLVDSVQFLFASVKGPGAKEPDPKKEAGPKLEEELVKKLKEPKDAAFPELAWAVVKALTDVPQLKAEQVRLAQGALAALKPTQRYVELVYVERLVALANLLQDKDPDTWQWQPEKVQAVLQTMRAQQAVIAALNQEPTLLPWIGPALDDADKQRRSGERKLLSGPPKNWKEAFQELRSAKTNYEQALEMVQLLRRCRLDLDHSFAGLPAYMLLVCDWPEFDAQAKEAWDKAAKEVTELQKFFADPPDKTAGGKFVVPALKLDNHQKDLHRQLTYLHEKVLQQRIERAERAEKDKSAEALDQLRCLLESPLLKAPMRAKVFTKHRALAAELHELIEKLDDDDNRAGRISSFPDAARRPQEATVRDARARMSLALLALGGFDARERKLVLPAVDAKGAPQQWANVERGLQDFWAKDLVKQWHNPRTPLLADSLNRIVPPWETEKRAAPQKEPSRQIQRNARESFLDWLQARYQAEAAAQEPPANDFYLEAARELRLRDTAPN